jgi:hypothetical protein
MEKKAFRENFISTFCATWCANNYLQYCMEGKQKELGKPPVEDAAFLADEAWEHYKKNVLPYE